jgi:hypothetical protein
MRSAPVREIDAGEMLSACLAAAVPPSSARDLSAGDVHQTLSLALMGPKDL